MGGTLYSVVILALIGASVGLLLWVRKKNAGPQKPPQKGIIR